MGFGDLKNKTGLQALNEFLAQKSYIEGYVPSQADVVIFHAVGKSPGADLVHVARWYNHVKSYSKDFGSLPGVKKPASEYGPAGDGKNDDDDDDDLFGSDDDEDAEEVARLKQERLEAYNAKKAKKPTLIAKSNIILDVKPWDDETDMKELEKRVRSIEADGLLWGTGKLVPVAYGIKKLTISCVVEDDKISTDFLEEKILEFDEYIQSMDIAAFNKI
ncbi:elongation factor 1-beta-like [Antedon mediterranea]|uniref:elongation factor 1-beta-like n=1 Tax=Antedon mediterranea TaxID=105859 RepID=UPI003AF814FA